MGYTSFFEWLGISVEDCHVLGARSSSNWLCNLPKIDDVLVHPGISRYDVFIYIYIYNIECMYKAADLICSSQIFINHWNVTTCLMRWSLIRFNNSSVLINALRSYNTQLLSVFDLCSKNVRDILHTKDPAGLLYFFFYFRTETDTLLDKWRLIVPQPVPIYAKTYTGMFWRGNILKAGPS